MGSDGEILQEIRTVLMEQCDTAPGRAAEITLDDPVSALELDSITMAYVFSHFEQKHDLTFENDDIDPMRYTTVRELVETLSGRIAEAGAQ
ncbi:acyl carrier protein [Streptomyces sp. NPDC015032]|uniref:acyl carrier protein n=1 Tax=Streptomyces sp. NPDC015032 TaxID=3364937 RepID=UPI0037006D60